MVLLKKMFKKELNDSEAVTEKEAYDTLKEKGISDEDIQVNVKKMMGMDYKDSIGETEIDFSDWDKEEVRGKGVVPYKEEGNMVHFIINGMMSKETKKLVDEEAKKFGKKKGKADVFQFDFQFDETIEKFFSNSVGSVGGKVYSIEESDWDAEYVSNDIIDKAIRERATDVHIEPVEEGFLVKYRIDGILSVKDTFKVGNEQYKELISRMKLTAEMKTEEKRKGQDSRIRAYKYKDKVFDIRVSTIAQVKGEKIALRMLERTNQVPSMRDLGFSKFYINAIQKDMQKHSGLILNTGSVGSGKSTTQTTLLNSLDAWENNIYSIEDPVERTIDYVNHVCVHETKVSFEEHLETLLRQDPDIVAIGEIRNLRTMDMALKAALSGQLVFATMHTNSAVEALYRLFNMGVESYELGAALQGISSQRLARTLCPYCKETREVEKPEKKIIENMMSRYGQYDEGSLKRFDYVHEACGCDHCNYTGYYGRTVLGEYLSVSPEIKNYIAEGEVSRDKILELADNTFVPVELDALNKVLLGKTTIGEIVKVV